MERSRGGLPDGRGDERERAVRSSAEVFRTLPPQPEAVIENNPSAIKWRIMWPQNLNPGPTTGPGVNTLYENCSLPTPRVITRLTSFYQPETREGANGIGPMRQSQAVATIEAVARRAS